ncbi:hypothetical protein SIM91_04985 [Rhodococcus opacus]|uniref:hypothetical protein n=1 Tax=Rhodococcus opacus TaxID=37919 RepID=UPI0002A34893|nr:hypothetical protein [Rhodococcus opacus]ELB88164.1 hypothetical protein Rwratislav_36054 [Rhodococcus wratislaviensis IFP 2016]MDX5962678.1 hypothetical protein [Rhodococcus opacus]CAG7636354.1 hypothetical protein E143388_07787 [Rhodococcus opacus]
MALQSARPNRFGDTAPASPATVAAATQTAPAEETTAAPLTSVPAPTPAPEAAPEAPAAPAKKPAAKKAPKPAATESTDKLRKSVEWSSDVEALFQDGCDDWYGDRNKRERKRRLGRRPSDNGMVIALVKLGLEAIADNEKYNDRLEELLPSDGRRRTS